MQHNLTQFIDGLRTAVKGIAGEGWLSYLGPGLIVLGFVLQAVAGVVQILHQ